MSDDQDKIDGNPITYVVGSSGGWIVTLPTVPPPQWMTVGGFTTGDLTGEATLPIVIKRIVKQQKVAHGNCEGYRCTTCNDFHPMAELNWPKNAEEFTNFVCYECRNNLK